jgi:hypothetical protein
LMRNALELCDIAAVFEAGYLFLGMINIDDTLCEPDHPKQISRERFEGFTGIDTAPYEEKYIVF